MEKDYRMNKNHTVINEVNKLEEFIQNSLSKKAHDSSSSTRSAVSFKRNGKCGQGHRCIALIRCMQAEDIDFWNAVRNKEKLDNWFTLEIDLSSHKANKIYNEIATKSAKQLDAIEKQKETDRMLSCLVQSHEKNFLFYGKE